MYGLLWICKLTRTTKVNFYGHKMECLVGFTKKFVNVKDVYNYFAASIKIGLL